MVLTVNNQEYKFNATMKQIVELTKRFEVNNFRTTFFAAATEVDFDFLAKIILALADEDTKKIFNNNIDNVYNFMEEWVNENDSDYSELYKKMAETINDKSFFGKRMSMEQLKAEMENPLASFDINKIVQQATEKAVGNMTAETIETATDKGFQGYKG